ncbi:MAG: RNA methyltransferase, partial [Phascolarctobacterium sp.]|nr:RNA methyltransferase [Phascolarctobacterium sp.]
MTAEMYVGLLHYPVYNRHMEVIASAVTNFDIHDIARVCRIYDVKRYYIIHPLDSQKELIEKILGFWREGYVYRYNPDRFEALKMTYWKDSLESVTEDIKILTGKKPYIVATNAGIWQNMISYNFLRVKLKGERLILLIFGTGSGIEKKTMEKFDYILEPIYGKGYNHLSVRSTA